MTRKQGQFGMDQLTALMGELDLPMNAEGLLTAQAILLGRILAAMNDISETQNRNSTTLSFIQKQTYRGVTRT